MLKPEDCKPGVEVIAIKNRSTGSSRPPLSIGIIYTLKGLFPFSFSVSNNTIVGEPVVALCEVAASKYGSDWGYELDLFKIRNIEQFEGLFRLNDVPQCLKDEVLQQEENEKELQRG